MSLAHGNNVHNPGPVDINPSLYCTQQNLPQALNCKNVPDLTDTILQHAYNTFTHKKHLISFSHVCDHNTNGQSVTECKY